MQIPAQQEIYAIPSLFDADTRTKLVHALLRCDSVWDLAPHLLETNEMFQQNLRHCK